MENKIYVQQVNPLSCINLQSRKTSSNKQFIFTQPIVKKILSEKEELVISNIQFNFRDNHRSILPMSNSSSHLMSNLNPVHIPDGAAAYFVSSLTDIPTNFKINPSSNTDIPSPSSSSNSSTNHHHPHHQQHSHHPTRRHGEGNDPTRKREMRLQKNREAARECRRKKKEYIKCLEERVASLEAQNKALIEELRQLKELYCQREDTNKKK